MTFTVENLLFMGSILIFSSIMIGKAGGKFGVPTLLIFMVVGMLFGEDGLGIQFDNIRITQLIGTVALCIILFTGGIETKWETIKPVMGPGLSLATAGVMMTTALTGVFFFFIAKWLNMPLQLPLVTCLLLAATMSSTDSASVFNILRTRKMGLKNNLQPILELESGSNDPMAYVLTVVLIGVCTSMQAIEGSLASTQEIVRNAVITLFQQFSVGLACGFGMGYAARKIINKVEFNNQALYAVMMLCVMFFIFSATGMLQGNGYLAVYISGVFMGNQPLAKRKHITAFLDTITWLMQIVMFLTLGLLVTPSEMIKTAPIALLIAVFMMLVARPISVFTCLLPFKEIKFKSKLFTSWVGLRGAVPIIFATYPVVAGIEGADVIFNIVFFITLLSLIIQGSTIPVVANKLDLVGEVEEEEDQFGIEIPEDVGQVTEIVIEEKHLAAGNTLKEINLPEGALVISIKRDGKFYIPNGSVAIQPEDRLLVMKANEFQVEAESKA